MSLSEIIHNHQKEILDSNILVEYNLFFSTSHNQINRFVLDGCTELGELNNLLIKIKELDDNAEIYVNAYGLCGMDTEIFIYADTLWINTTVGINIIANLFNSISDISPSDIVLLKNNERVDGKIDFVVLADGMIESYKSFISKRDLGMIKSIYWD